MGMFIRVEIDDKKCLGLEKSGECIRICPVNIFEARVAEPIDAKIEPQSIVDAQFSMPFCVAVALLYGEAGPENFR